MFGVRLIRKRWVLAVIFGCSLLYFITNIHRQSQQLHVVITEAAPVRPAEPVRWQVNWEANSSKILTCRNSVQGKDLIADDKGYVCERQNILPGGCCDIESDSSSRFECQTCDSNGCCAIYEHCVSCCLQPEKQALLRKILSKASDTFQQLFASVTDHFELCLTKCRTSSQSVQHENSYRDPKARFCYGENLPDAQPGPA